MSHGSEAYNLASHIHDSFYGDADLLTPDEIETSGIISVIGSSSSRTSLRIEAIGEIAGRMAWQTLAKDKRGNFHLSTTFTEYGGEHIKSLIHKEAPFEAVELLTDTIFMRKLVAIARDQNQG